VSVGTELEAVIPGVVGVRVYRSLEGSLNRRNRYESLEDVVRGVGGHVIGATQGMYFDVATLVFYTAAADYAMNGNWKEAAFAGVVGMSARVLLVRGAELLEQFYKSDYIKRLESNQ
jgi:hypothetical protein